MPKPTRFPFGLAIGWENQFNNYGKTSGPNTANPIPASQQYESVTAGLLAQASTAPDVSFGSLFYTNNSSTTIITDFKTTWMGRSGSNLASGQVDTSGPPPEGKLITIVFLDNSTQLANAGNLILAGTDNLAGANHVITLLGSNGKWIEIERSKNTTAQVSTFTIGTASSINSNDVSLAFITGTATPVQVKAISGGQVGQILTMVGLGSSGISAYAMTGGNINIVGTNSFLIPNSGALQFIKINASLWNMYEIGTSAGVQ